MNTLGHIQRCNSIAHGFNRYAFANNNPYKYTSPDWEFFFLAIAAVGAAITAYDTYQNEGASQQQNLLLWVELQFDDSGSTTQKSRVARVGVT